MVLGWTSDESQFAVDERGRIRANPLAQLDVANTQGLTQELAASSEVIVDVASAYSCLLGHVLQTQPSKYAIALQDVERSLHDPMLGQFAVTFRCWFRFDRLCHCCLSWSLTDTMSGVSAVDTGFVRGET